jgi:hypothetical protein
VGPRSRDGPNFRPNPICGADRAVQAGASRLTDSPGVAEGARSSLQAGSSTRGLQSPRTRAAIAYTGAGKDRFPGRPMSTSSSSHGTGAVAMEIVSSRHGGGCRSGSSAEPTPPQQDCTGTVLVRIALGYGKRGPGPGERVTFLRHPTSDASSHGRRETDSMARAAPGLGVA